MGGSPLVSLNNSIKWAPSKKMGHAHFGGRSSTSTGTMLKSPASPPAPGCAMLPPALAAGRSSSAATSEQLHKMGVPPAFRTQTKTQNKARRSDTEQQKHTQDGMASDRGLAQVETHSPTKPLSSAPWPVQVFQPRPARQGKAQHGAADRLSSWVGSAPGKPEGLPMRFPVV